VHKTPAPDAAASPARKPTASEAAAAPNSTHKSPAMDPGPAPAAAKAGAGSDTERSAP